MAKKPFSDARWWDDPGGHTTQCGYCKNYLGYQDGVCKCKAFDQIPRDILADFVLHDHPIDGDHGYQYKAKDSNTPKPQKTPRY